MANGKKSFTAYCDWGDSFDQLTDEQLGKVTRHIWDYVRDKDPKTDDFVVNLVFAPIRATLKRDLKKWETFVKKQSENGKKGGRPKKTKETQETQALNKNPSQAKKAVSVRVSDRVSVSDKVKEKINIPAFSDFLDYAKSKESKINQQGLKLNFGS